MFCAKFGWNWRSSSGEKDENVKSLQTDRQTDRRTSGDQKTSFEHSAGELKAVDKSEFELKMCTFYVRLVSIFVFDTVLEQN